jgi:hypothetical protein
VQAPAMTRPRNAPEPQLRVVSNVAPVYFLVLDKQVIILQIKDPYSLNFQDVLYDENILQILRPNY